MEDTLDNPSINGTDSLKAKVDIFVKFDITKNLVISFILEFVILRSSRVRDYNFVLFLSNNVI